MDDMTIMTIELVLALIIVGIAVLLMTGRKSNASDDDWDDDIEIWTKNTSCIYNIT